MYLLCIFPTIPLLLQKDDGDPRHRPVVFASADGNWNARGGGRKRAIIGWERNSVCVTEELVSCVWIWQSNRWFVSHLWNGNYEDDLPCTVLKLSRQNLLSPSLFWIETSSSLYVMQKLLTLYRWQTCVLYEVKCFIFYSWQKFIILGINLLAIQNITCGCVESNFSMNIEKNSINKCRLNLLI